jgi:hypothetical protein
MMCHVSRLQFASILSSELSKHAISKDTKSIMKVYIVFLSYACIILLTC